MRIGIDLDEVIVELVKPVIDYYNNKYKTNIKYEDITSYNFWEHGIGRNRDEAITILDDFYDLPIFEKLPFINGAKSAIKILKDENSLSILTSRPLRYKPKTQTFILNNLGDIATYYTTDFSKEEGLTKAEKAKQLNLDVIIEDNQDYALDCLNKGIRVFLLNKRWNKNADSRIERVYNWGEILDKLE